MIQYITRHRNNETEDRIMSQRKKKNGIKKVLIIILVIIAICIIAVGIYLGKYYHSVDASEYLGSTTEVTVQQFEYGLFFDGEGEDTALIFYPGAKVATDAYAPIMRMLAENGVDCFLVDMPFHMAFFGSNRAEKIMQDYSYDNWYLGGHSLGGAMAANFAADHTDELTGLLLLAAYPTKDLSGSNLKVLTVYGSNDGVLNMDKVASGRELLPADSTEICIEGGNHAQFGSYGEQKGDGAAEIPAEEQWEKTVEAVMEMVRK